MILPPGQPPTFVNPMPNGGSMIQPPGEPPTFVNPMPNGGYMVQPPFRGLGGSSRFGSSNDDSDDGDN